MFLSKSVVRFPVAYGFPGLLKPPGTDLCLAVKLRYIRFDVYQWRSIQDVDILNVKVTFLNPVELDR